jgi:hypothetical protein
MKNWDTGWLSWGRGFDSLWSHCFQLDCSFQPRYGRGIRFSFYQEVRISWIFLARKANSLTAICERLSTPVVFNFLCSRTPRCNFSSTLYSQICWYIKTKETKFHGLSPRANYTNRATTASQRSDCQLLRIEGATWSAWRIPTAVF